MKWFTKPDAMMKDRRVKSWFAWLPVTIGLEHRWLERVIVLQEYNFGGFDSSLYWENLEFIDENA